MDKIIKINFEEWQDAAYVDEGLDAWNYGQILRVEGLTLPDGNIEVHFSLTDREGDANVYIGTVKDNVLTVSIPDFIFQKEDVYQPTYDAYAFVYQTDEDSGRTIKKITFTIKGRPEPTTGVPEPKQDPFLEEVRKVMAETKNIAQSVRDDADNGAFDGEKGDKGDAGAIEFKIVNELPTEDISESAMYLVPLSPSSENNEFAEYIYANGHWEYIGSASVEVNVDDFVKKDDYATADKVGLVKVSRSGGATVNDEGRLVLDSAGRTEIDSRQNYRNPIVPKNLDYAVKKALSDCKLEGDDAWTNKEKAKALELLGGVGKQSVSRLSVYAVDEEGNQIVIGTCKNAANNGMIPLYNSSGQINVATPTADNHATTKKYVDERVGSVETILTELHTYAQTKIGGEA